jgi:hypothetical protein
MEPPE